MIVTGSAAIDSYGFTYASSDAFREGVLAADGRSFMIRRNNAAFVIIGADGTATEHHLGLEGVTLNTSGGCLGADNKIYSPPRDSNFILIIDPATDSATTSKLGATIGTDQNKWTGAVLGNNGKIYCTPSIATDILIIDTTTDPATATRSNLGVTWSPADSTTESIMWVGGVKAPDGRIFFTPFSSPHCLIIDPATETATLTDFGGVISGGSGSNKWTGAALGPDGKIYCSPRNADSILVIDPATDTAELKTYGLDLSGTDKYARIFTGRDGRIYMPPSAASDILVIDTRLGEAQKWLPEGFSFGGLSNPKWIGGTVAGDGKIYCPPRMSQTFLIIDPPDILTHTLSGLPPGLHEIEIRGTNDDGDSEWSNVAQVYIPHTSRQKPQPIGAGIV